MKIEVLTTGQVAKICRVSPGTVARWCTENRLLHYAIPGAMHRRVEVSQLRLFMAAHSLPMHWLEEGVKELERTKPD